MGLGYPVPARLCAAARAPAARQPHRDRRALGSGAAFDADEHRGAARTAGWGRRRQGPILTGGVAVFAFLALFPALMAAVTIYGLVADPGDVAGQVRRPAATLPRNAQPIVGEQPAAVVISSSQGALGFGL